MQKCNRTAYCPVEVVVQLTVRIQHVKGKGILATALLV